MKWTGLNELREKYLSFFESKGHLRLKSYSLVPDGDDNTLLLINAGMAPMKKFFLMQQTPPAKRVCTCQKCVRTLDIDRVGKTARHGSYFEMLGNFSFGDYFKNEATAFAWEFITKVLEMPEERLWVSIYLDDDEAFDIWTKQVGVSPERIVRFGKEDNFWEHGALPCGPCSEIFFDRGEEYGCGSPDCKVGCDCDRFVEFWNLVFQQFDSDGKGNYTRLPKPNIDTGLGLERLACLMQNVNNLFEVDTVQNIMKHISRIAGVSYGESEKTDISLRVVTDHIRSTTFLVGDGVMPSNEGRGYVLRRLLRRAARHGRMLGINRPFLSEVCDTVIDENRDAYPELVEKREFIKKLIANEEASFDKTIDQGLNLLNELIREVDGNMLSGEAAFRLYDTFGFPLDLTTDILEEQGMSVDEQRFTELMNEQRVRARNARRTDGGSGATLNLTGIAATEFVGYEQLQVQGSIAAIICEDEPVEAVSAGSRALLILDKTSFYAQSGGQVGDTGVISCGDARFEVEDTVKNGDGVYIHRGIMREGILNKGDGVLAQVDEQRRADIMRNHTAAHLLQHALRQVLGAHVEQAGQLVNEKHLRFDFTHFSALSEQEIKSVEQIMNSEILSCTPVTTQVMPIEKAKTLGAIALFGEKYGDEVRVVTAGNSVELCGGTHAPNTGMLGLVHIVSEGSIASGVRRIEAVTGRNVINYIDSQETLLQNACSTLKIGNSGELFDKLSAMQAELRESARELEALKAKQAAGQASSLIEKAIAVGSVRVITTVIDGAAPDALRSMCDSIKADYPDVVAVIAGQQEQKLTFAACCGKDAVAQGAHAGNIVREVAKLTGGSGGGRPDSAMAGGRDTAKVSEALAAVGDILKSMLK